MSPLVIVLLKKFVEQTHYVSSKNIDINGNLFNIIRLTVIPRSWKTLYIQKISLDID